MTKLTIFLDLDGVCCRFTDSLFKAIGKEDLIGNWPVGAKDIQEASGMPNEIIWKIIDKYGYKFWRNLEEYPWFKEMYKALNDLGDVVFLTSPSRSPECAKGKVMWLQDRFGEEFNSYIITKKKYYCARAKNSLLIDDTVEQIDLFKEYEGTGILFPQPWNYLKDIKTPYEYILREINDYINQKS